jgi:hypothetical protein
MATRTWAGGAARVAQVQTYAFGGTWEADDLIRCAIGNKSVDVAAGSATTATVVANLVAAWNALSSADYPEFAEVTAAANTTTLTLTGDAAGRPFVATLTPLEANGDPADAQEIGGGGIATTGVAATACSGPNFWDVAANWLENAVPVNSDDVVIDRGPAIRYGLAQGAVTLASLKVGPNFPAASEIGLPNHTSPFNPESGYPEYRTQRLTIGATTVTLDSPSRRIRLDLSGASTTVVVGDSGQPQTAGEDAVDLKATTTANVFVSKGFVGVNAVPGDAGTIADLNVAFRTSVESDARVRCGAGCTVTNLDMSGGQVELLNGAATVTKSGGTLTLRGAVPTALYNYGGLVYLDGTGTIALLENKGQAYRRGFQALTITTLRLYAGSEGGSGDAPVTFSNPVEWYKCRLPAGPNDRAADVAYWNFGTHKKYTPAAI